MRGVVALVNAANFYNFLFVSVLAPLLPTLARDFGFSKSGAGVLTAA
jgi:predicted MFS family arabinose efflux permease